MQSIAVLLGAACVATAYAQSPAIVDESGRPSTDQIEQPHNATASKKQAPKQRIDLNYPDALDKEIARGLGLEQSTRAVLSERLGARLDPFESSAQEQALRLQAMAPLRAAATPSGLMTWEYFKQAYGYEGLTTSEKQALVALFEREHVPKWEALYPGQAEVFKAQKPFFADDSRQTNTVAVKQSATVAASNATAPRLTANTPRSLPPLGGAAATRDLDVVDVGGFIGTALGGLAGSAVLSLAFVVTGRRVKSDRAQFAMKVCAYGATILLALIYLCALFAISTSSIRGTSGVMVGCAIWAFYLWKWLLPRKQRTIKTGFVASTSVRPRQVPSSDTTATKQAALLSSVNAAPDPTDDSWAQALLEFDSDRRQLDLWANVYAATDGDEPKAKAQYLRQRVAQLVAAKT